MTAALRWVVGGVLCLGLGVTTALLSVAPWRVPGAGQALLRLAWTGRPERIERCRRLSDAELADVPVHMRQRVQCEGRSSRYLLHVATDGQAILVDTLRGGGLRHDRPMHLLRDIALAPGAHRLTLRLARLDSMPPEADSLDAGPGPATGPSLGSASRDEREREERARARREALPGLVTLDTLLRLAPSEIAIVGYDPDRRVLVLLRGARERP